MYKDISEEWKKQCEHIQQICQPINTQSFGVDKMQRDINMQFKVVQYMTQTEEHLKKLYTNPDHFSFNRNSNIMTFDQNRVLLGENQHKQSPDYYINANFIQINGHQLIATQGPLHSTFNNFWKMIDKFKVAAVFMLCERVEKQKVKCDLYWPTKAQQNFDVGDFQIRLISKQQQGDYIKNRKFLIKNKVTKEQRQVSHYQFSGWPDGDKPLQVASNALNKLLQRLIKILQNEEMGIVHCSAGVGRTGTFIAMAQIKMLIPKVEAISIFEIVRKLRQQRWAMVYTATQYEYLYQFAQEQSDMYHQKKKQLKYQDDCQGSNEEQFTQNNC